MPETPEPVSLSAEDDAALRRAAETLEFPGIFARAVRAVGDPLEKLVRTLPSGVEDSISRATETALRRAAQLAKIGLGGRWRVFDSTWSHRIEGVITGAAGGALGAAGLVAELPITTALILRSILLVAREQGEDLSSADVLNECLKVFAFGGERRDGGSDSAYFAARAALPRVAAKASDIIPRIAARYAVPVSQKVAAQAAPLIGAVGGASLNLAFIAHFQSIALAHFTVRRLERAYGQQAVQSRYLQHLQAAGGAQ